MLSDLFTLLRILSGLFILYLAIFNINNFHLYFYTILFGWTTDILDGFFARLPIKKVNLVNMIFK